MSPKNQESRTQLQKNAHSLKGMPLSNCRANRNWETTQQNSSNRPKSNSNGVLRSNTDGTTSSIIAVHYVVANIPSMLTISPLSVNMDSISAS